MKMIRIKTLQQRTVFFVLIPTFLFLTAMGWGGYVFARNSLLLQWGETAIANLQKAAHGVDMRLERPKDLLQRLKYSSGEGMGHLSFQYTIDQLRQLEGVQTVKIVLPGEKESRVSIEQFKGMGMKFKVLEDVSFSVPSFKWSHENRTISIVSELISPEKNERGKIEVTVEISDLVKKLAKSPWWKSHQTLLIDLDGHIIASSTYKKDTENVEMKKTFGAKNTLEKMTMAEIKSKLHGTVFGTGHPPAEISGFYRLSEAPWFMVVVAPGDTVLQPILKFRLYYSLLFATAILLIITFIRSMTTKMTDAIHSVSVAAEGLAKGVFGPPLPVQSSDELGELTQSFNEMTSQLQQGLELQKAMEIAREVQQNFLPSTKYENEGIEVYGSSRYCHETGGDFFDVLKYKSNPFKIGAVVGDVVGHGVGAALLMASVRAMIRTRSEQPGDLESIVGDVNRVLCKDTEVSSNFVTLFYLTIDSSAKTLEWVRAGHDPAFLYYPNRNEFCELRGKGVALGIDDSLLYERNCIPLIAEDQLVVIGSDGAWEAENAAGMAFGKDRLKEIIKNNLSEGPEKIIEIINEEIDLYLDGTPPQDDITFVVIKIKGGSMCSVEESI